MKIPYHPGIGPGIFKRQATLSLDKKQGSDVIISGRVFRLLSVLVIYNVSSAYTTIYR